jgi:hypothetical protein
VRTADGTPAVHPRVMISRTSEIILTHAGAYLALNPIGRAGSRRPTRHEPRLILLLWMLRSWETSAHEAWTAELSSPELDQLVHRRH